MYPLPPFVTKIKRVFESHSGHMLLARAPFAVAFHEGGEPRDSLWLCMTQVSTGGRSDPAVISQGLNWSAFLTSESYFELAVQHRLLAQLAFPPCRPSHCLEIAALFPRLRKLSGLPPELAFEGVESVSTPMLTLRAAGLLEGSGWASVRHMRHGLSEHHTGAAQCGCSDTGQLGLVVVTQCCSVWLLSHSAAHTAMQIQNSKSYSIKYDVNIHIIYCFSKTLVTRYSFITDHLYGQ